MNYFMGLNISVLMEKLESDVNSEAHLDDTLEND